jgi:hypothetical protein
VVTRKEQLPKKTENPQEINRTKQRSTAISCHRAQLAFSVLFIDF